MYSCPKNLPITIVHSFIFYGELGSCVLQTEEPQISKSLIEW